jgi:cytochrome P450
MVRSGIFLTLVSFVSQGHIRDITDSLIEHCQDRKLDENANVQLSDDKVITIVLDLFGAGTCTLVYHFCAQVPLVAAYLTTASVPSCSGFDTVTTAISWSLMYLVTNPRVQRKIQEELGRW